MGHAVKYEIASTGFFFVAGHFVASTGQEPAILHGEMPTVGETLKRLRSDAGLTPEDLAKDAGVSRSTVYRIEGGEIPDPDLATLRGLVTALNLSLSEFFRRVEGQTPMDSSSALHKMAPFHGSADVSAVGESEVLTTLAWACLRAADSAERLNTQAILEELAVSFTRAANPGDQSAIHGARERVRSVRRDRKEREGN